MSKPKVAFICVHNSCRSQIAEAQGKQFAADIFESYSAGTELNDRINPDAVRLMKQLYGIDMEKSQHSKLLADIPPVDVVVTMDIVHLSGILLQVLVQEGLERPHRKLHFGRRNRQEALVTLVGIGDHVPLSLTLMPPFIIYDTRKATPNGVAFFGGE